jgi:dipeptidyl aminopeptidase/acylaminoacyl peptidase
MAPHDFFTLRDPSNVELAPDGSEVVYTQTEADLAQDRYVSTLWRVATDGRTPPTRLTEREGDFAPQWAPDSRSVAFLSARTGTVQLWQRRRQGGEIVQLTHVPAGVASFRWAPDGHHIAFVAADDSLTTLDLRETAGESRPVTPVHQGVVIDRTRNLWWDVARLGTRPFCGQAHLWVLAVETSEATPILPEFGLSGSCGGDGNSGYTWSPTSDRIAIAGGGGADFGLVSNTQDVVIYSVAERRVVSALRGERGRDWSHQSEYSAPVWLADGTAIIAKYKHWRDRWDSPARFGVYSAALGTEQSSPWGMPADFEADGARIVWVGSRSVLIENTVRAVRHLYMVDPATGHVDRVMPGDDYESEFSVSGDGRTIAFIRQGPQVPPEIYVASLPQAGHGEAVRLRPLTFINQHLGSLHLPKTEHITWASTDGATIEGWLMKPLDYRAGTRYPLLVFDHGGPTGALANSFLPYFDIWPYPFQLFATRGFAVFMPNPRMTGTFGQAYRTVKDIAVQPVQDVMTGVDALIRRGLVDSTRMGIIGHSYGGYLGPLVMTTRRDFAAAAFAEGSPDLFVLYGINPTASAVNLNEYYWGLGKSPYEDPSRYVKASPAFHVMGLHTPVLLEYGEGWLISAGLSGYMFAGALQRAGVPMEYVVYPNTGHNIYLPSLQLESMNRTLDWFVYWLQGERDPDPAKAAQYARWDTMVRTQH